MGKLKFSVNINLDENIAKKRKHKNKNHASKKQKSDETSDNEIREPSQEELAESLKPENQIGIETIRQKKQKSHSKNVDNWKLNVSLTESRRNIDYLNKWKSDRESWKFEKLRQISIQKCIFDEEKLPETIWYTVVEYLEGCKGRARDELIEKSEYIIKEIDQQSTPDHDSEIKIKYKRARDVLQILK